LQIRELMHTDIVTVLPSMTVLELDALLTNSGISGAPVVDEAGKTIGMVSKTDVVRALGEEFVQLDKPVAEILVLDIMTRAVVYTQADESVVSVAQQMLDRRIHRVLVYDGEEPVGMVTTFDMLRIVVSMSEDLG